jgi:hypothetical protein
MLVCQFRHFPARRIIPLETALPSGDRQKDFCFWDFALLLLERVAGYLLNLKKKQKRRL